MDTAEMTPETTLPVPPPVANGKNGHAKTNGKNGHGASASDGETKVKKNKKAAKPKKAKAAKAAPAKKDGAKRGKPAREELKFEDMTSDEQKIVKFLFSPKGPRVAHKINDIQKEVFGKEKTGSSRTRNNLRRLVKFGWVEKADRGAYRLTEKGRKRGIKKS